MAMSRAVFIDRDDTILQDESYMSRVSQVRLIPGVDRALGQLQGHGWELVLISNQSGVGRGWITPGQVQAIQDRMCQLLGLTFAGFEYCFHRPDQQCGCRKPSPVMILRAAERLGIDLGRSVMVGDRAKDVEAGNAAGCWSVLVSSDETRQAGCLPDLVVPDLGGAAAWIMGLSHKKGFAQGTLISKRCPSTPR